MKKYKLLFLDIDGVLNHSVYKGSTFLVEPDVPVCKDNLEALKYIIDNTEDLGIVWSSQWRLTEDKHFDKDWYNPRLYIEKLDWFKKYLIDVTPAKLSSNHFQEIHFWFSKNAENKKYVGKSIFTEQVFDYSNYVIIDDLDSDGMKKYGDHFFLANSEIGLTVEMAKNIVEYFKQDFSFETLKEELDWANNWN